MKQSLPFLPVIGIIALCYATPLIGEENALTAEQKADGWILLFDGKTLKG